MKKSTMLILGGAAVLGFLYIRHQSETATPATVNAGTAAPVGNTATPATGTENAQSAAGSEAAYVARPAASPFDFATKRLRELYDSMSNNKELT